ncbi:MAG: hypothetical protein ACP5QR_08200 [Rhizomicrobium sp.]
MPEGEVIDELIANGSAALDRVIGNLPADFPAEIAEAIAGGFHGRLDQLKLGRKNMA